MATVRWWGWAGALCAAALAAAGCGSSSKSGSAAPPPATSQGSLTMEIQSVTLPDPTSAGTAAAQQRPVVRFRVVDTTTNQPVNLANEVAASNATPPGTPNSIPRFTLAQRDDRNDYRSYYGTVANPVPYVTPQGYTTPPAAPALQSAYEPPSGKWPVADLKDVGGGFYEYTMPPTNQTGFDRSKTHTLAGWVVRSNGTADADVAMASFDFVPAGGTPTSYETVTDARCNQCHGFVQAHGTRRGVHLCMNCHSPSTTDPDTSRTVDFKVLIHKIHSGSTLPSVEQGKGYYIVGFRGTIVDFSDVVFPYHNHGVAHCTACHSGGAQSDNWKQVPTQNVCSSCHDNVQFASSAGLDPCPVGTTAAVSFKDCLHTGGPITITDSRDPANCMGCHGPGTAAAVDKFHHGD
jgi:OmcA/MtrC family decaheme c-type cytochrome